MKKIITIICAVLISLSTCLFGCGDSNSNKPSIVCTIFPEYDWVCQILGDDKENFDITILQDSGVDLHNYQPTAKDILKLSKCDVFIYVGGESDEWVEDTLRTADNKNMITINLMEVLKENLRLEEEKDGMESEEEGEGEGEEEEEYDEHVWLSIKNAKVACKEIEKKLSSLYVDNASKYSENLTNYLLELDKVDNDYKEAVDNATYNTVVFGDRFPFLYLFKDYGLDYFAAFKGCSADSEASFKTIKFLAEKVDELGLPAICKIDGASHTIYETVKQNTKNKNQQIVSFDSMQSITQKEIDDGKTYISVCKSNLNNLKIALGE